MSDDAQSKCPECGGDCSPECGLHPLGCIYGGFTQRSGYWIVIDGCTLNHGEHVDEPSTHRHREDT